MPAWAALRDRASPRRESEWRETDGLAVRSDRGRRRRRHRRMERRNVLHHRKDALQPRWM